MKMNKNYTKPEIIKMFNEILPNFDHIEKNMYLDAKM